MARPSLPSAEESTVLINEYCNQHHEGKLEPPLHAVRLDPKNPACTKLMQLCDKRAFTHPAIWYWCALNSVLVEGKDRPVDGLQFVTRRQYDLLRILFIPETVKPSIEAVTLVDCMGLRGMVEYLDMEIMIQVWLHNCFEHHQSPEGYAIYFMPSFCSHSCLPNALWCTDNDSNFRFFPRATIRAGDEVTLTYLSEDDMLRNTSHRRQLLEGAKDFKCMCERCTSPVDFSRGFRCPRCRSGVVYVHADETGDEEEFGGALLRAPTTSAPVTEEQRQRQGSNSASHSPIPEERSPDTWRQPLGPQSLYPETARGSADWSGGKETPAEAATNLSLHTIWARLLAELKNDTAVQEHETDAASVADAGAAATPGTSPFFSKTSGIVSTQVAAQVLQGARNGCCCSCRRRWRDSERLRALAVERILEDVFNSLDNPESEIRDGADKSPANSLSGVSGGSDRDSCTASSNSNDSDARAHELLQRLEPDELLHIVKKKWNLLEKNERRVVDAIIKLTFNKHWLAAQWYRFLESISSPRRKLLYLDRLIWQYRNLYPGLTPALAWAIWDVAQALFSLGENSKLRKCAGFRRFADLCILSSYTESVFILTTLFGPDGSFPSSIVNSYADSVKECLERLTRQTAPRLPRTTEPCGGCCASQSVAMPLKQSIQLPQVWPWYISSCADIAVTNAEGTSVIPGRSIFGELAI